MPKPEWGTKRICQSCSARFYDLGRTPIVCPSCGAVFDLEVLNRSRRARPAPRAAAAVVEDEEETPKEAESTETDDVEEEAAEEEVAEESSDEDDDALIEDAEELGDDDDDMGDVIDGDIEEEGSR